MGPLAPRGSITTSMVDEEGARLQGQWQAGRLDPDSKLLFEVLGERASDLDRFDRVQLAEVVRVCQSCASLRAAGRE